MLKKLLLMSICVFAAGAVHADYITGENYFNEGNYSAAFNAFLPDADAGDKRSQYYVGYLYLYGLGVSPDPQKAVEYLTASADKEYDNAQSLLGYLYEQGQVVSLNKKKAIELYTAAAEQNNPGAMFNLGLAYYKGDGVVRSSQKAIELLNKVPIDSYPYVGRYLGEIYMSTSDSNKVENAEKEYKRSARKGDIDSFYYLGQLYETERGDLPKAVPYYLYAASKNFAEAQYLLGTMYVMGRGVDEDLIQGHAWLEIAANQRHAAAQEAMTELDKKMTLRQSEKARQEFNRIQGKVINNVESPFIAEEAAQRKIEEEKEKKREKMGGRRRR